MKLKVLALLAVTTVAVSLTMVTSPSFSSAQVVKGSGSWACHVEGTITLNPPWKAGAKGTVKADVNLSGTGCSSNAVPRPTSVSATGHLKFPNGTCSTPENFDANQKLTITYTPEVKPSKFNLLESPFASRIFPDGVNKASVWLWASVSGSYPSPNGSELEPGPGTPIGNCSTGITGISWSGSTNPPQGLQFVGV